MGLIGKAAIKIEGPWKAFQVGGFRNHHKGNGKMSRKFSRTSKANKNQPE